MPHGGNHRWGGGGRGGWGGGWGRPILGAPLIGGYVDPIQPVVYVNPLVPIFFIIFFIIIIVAVVSNLAKKKESYKCLCDRLGKKKCSCATSKNKYIARAVDRVVGWGV